MASDIDDKIRADAIGWHIRLRDAGTEDWDAFTLWLEQDAAHADAYDVVALADSELAPAFADARLSSPRAANDDEVRPSWVTSRRVWLSGIAAVLIAVVAGPALIGGDRYDVATRPGEQRVVDLGEGSQVALNGSSRIELDRDNPRFAALDRGEATFTIRHDPGAPFMLELGDDRVQDVGTLFNVIRDSRGIIVEVAEGSILYNPQREAIALKAGQTLHDLAGAARVVVAAKNPVTIAAWRQGRLDYQSVPLAFIAADLSRNLGTHVMVDPAIAGRTFTGTIRIDRNQDRMFERLAPLLDVDARRGDAGWTMSARDRAVP